MTAKLDFAWHLRELMAARGMFSTTDLRPRLTERGVNLSTSQIYRLVVEKPERLNLATLMALLDILGCRMEELIEPVRAGGALRKTASDPAPEPGGSALEGVGSLRPKRARILPEQS